MTKLPVLAAILTLSVSAAPSLSEGSEANGKLISEDAVKAASAEQYSEVLVRACRNGWRYPRSQIEAGFKQHVAELKLRLVDQGYTVLPDMTANEPQGTISGTGGQLVASRRFSCSHPYWHDE